MSARSPGSADLLRTARGMSSLSQPELARRAGVAQSVISAYESGRREPSLRTLRRLIEASGNSLSMVIEPVPGATRGLPDTAMGRRIRQRRRALLEAAARFDVVDLTVFGSVARGDDGPESDVDIAATIPSSMGLVRLGSLERALSEILGRTVDLVPVDGLRPAVSRAIVVEGIPL